MDPSRCSSCGVVQLVVRFLLVALAVCEMGLFLLACGRGDMYFGAAGADAGADASTSAGCPADSTCVPLPQDNPQGPKLLWSGQHNIPFGSEDGGAPPCPYGGDYGFHGGIGLVAPTDCVPCTCGPS